MAHYQEDLLASGPEDEKEIDWAESRAEKDAKKDTERGANKRSRGGGRNNNKKRCLQYRDPSWYNFPGPCGGYYGNRQDQWGLPHRLRCLRDHISQRCWGHVSSEVDTAI